MRSASGLDVPSGKGPAPPSAGLRAACSVLLLFVPVPEGLANPGVHSELGCAGLRAQKMGDGDDF